LGSALIGSASREECLSTIVESIETTCESTSTEGLSDSLSSSVVSGSLGTSSVSFNSNSSALRSAEGIVGFGLEVAGSSTLSLTIDSLSSGSSGISLKGLGLGSSTLCSFGSLGSEVIGLSTDAS
jgi:hypothetical protein